MLLRHATLIRNLPGIERRGLLTRKSQGKRPVVWLHTAAKSFWAALHTVRRHGGPVEAVVILEVNVPRAWLRKSRKGLWYCPRDIPADAILSNHQGVLTVTNGTFSVQDIANHVLEGLAITPTSADGTQLALNATATTQTIGT